MNVYDVRLYDEVPACGMNWPPGLQEVTSYLDVAQGVRVQAVCTVLVGQPSLGKQRWLDKDVLPLDGLLDAAKARWATSKQCMHVWKSFEGGT